MSEESTSTNNKRLSKKEKQKEADKRFYSRYKKEILQRIHNNRVNEPERYREYRRQAYLNTEKGKPITDSEREYRRLYMKEYRAEKPKRSRYSEIRHKLVMVLGGKCVLCGFNKINALQIDHINGGGFITRLYFKNIVAERRHYLQNPIEAKNELQVLCANCHTLKTFENGDLPYYRSKGGIMATLRSVIDRPKGIK